MPTETIRLKSRGDWCTINFSNASIEVHYSRGGVVVVADLPDNLPLTYSYTTEEEDNGHSTDDVS